jgi:hypothetical protein
MIVGAPSAWAEPSRLVLAPADPAAEIVIDSKSGVQRTIRSTDLFRVTAGDFGSQNTLRLLFQAPGRARQARFLSREILLPDAQGVQAAPFELSRTQLYPEQIVIKFESYPPDATLSFEQVSGAGMKPQFQGRFAQLQVADRYDLAKGEFLSLHLLVTRPGYQPWRREYPLNNLAKPGQEVVNLPFIELTPATGWANRWEQFKVLHRFRTPLALAIDAVVLGVLMSVPLFLLPTYRRHKRERELWEKKALLESVITDTDPLLKKTLGGYFITARIGRGGMSKVYRGLPESTLDLDEAVAVKVIDEDLARSDEYRARFLREIEVSASLSHPNIVKLIDWGQSGHLLFMVQELIEGQTLKETFVRPLSQARFIHIFLPIMRALRTAHEKGVVHRDLKPSNIMVTHTDVIKLMDFGLAKANRPGHDLTRTGDAFGTPNYMSPEQISGGAIDAASDVYSLGIMAFELLTGQLPFDAGEDPMSVMLAHLQQDPKNLADFRKDLSPDIVAVVQKMMNKDPADRFPNLDPVIEIFEAAPRVY